LQQVVPIILQQNIFAVIDVPRGLPVGHLLDPTAQTIVPVDGRGGGGTCASRKFLNLGQSVFRIIRVLGRVPGRQQRLAGQIPVVVILVGMVRIRRELIPRVHEAPAGGPIPHRVIGEGLRIE
jgi:hypothetical protein